MKVLFLTNNEVSNPLIKWLEAREEVIVWQEKLSHDDMQRIRPDLAISYSYKHIIKKDVLDTLPGRFINLHISLLPFNRGADPNAWSFLDETPKGVTIHLIDSGIDTGPILYQREINFDYDRDTLGGSYSLLQEKIQDLFMEHWNAIRNDSAIPIQQTSQGTYHHSRDFSAIKEQLLGTEGWGVSVTLFKKRYQDLVHSNP